MSRWSRVPTPVIVLVGGLVALVLGDVVARALAHPLVRQAYAGTGPAVLTSVLRGRGVHSLEYYFNAVDSLVRQCTYVAGAGILVLAVLTSAGVREHIDRWVLASRPDLPTVGPDSRRASAGLAASTAIILLLVQGTAIATQLELWPFSPYSMYAALQPNPVSAVYVAAVTDSGEGRIDAARQAPPFDVARLPQALAVMSEALSPQEMDRALASVADLYERARIEHRHAGGPLRALRLYRAEWTIDPLLRNVDRPDRKTLLVEYIAHP